MNHLTGLIGSHIQILVVGRCLRSNPAFPPPLTGEFQPMASSASVASLVIAMETGLSDEEGSMEQSQMGDKS